MGSLAAAHLKNIHSIVRCCMLRPRSAVRLVILVGLLVWLYVPVFTALVSDWWNDPSSSHGFIIPPLAAYLAWTRRTSTLAIPVLPDARGLLLTLSACLLFLVGELGSEFFLNGISISILLAGLIWTFWGTARLRALSLPLLLLLTMVPIPVVLYNSLAMPLQLLASTTAAEVAQAWGVTVYQDGNIIHLANTSLGVAEACSGLRSLSSLLVLAMLLGFLRCSRLRSRIALIVTAVPVAIAVNVLRVSGTAILADANDELALGFYHAFSSWLAFLLAIALIFVAAKGAHAVLD